MNETVEALERLNKAFAKARKEMVAFNKVLRQERRHALVQLIKTGITNTLIAFFAGAGTALMIVTLLKLFGVL
ncbi:MAG: hypothetical protein ABFC88_12570 [Thermoguttaceae bacterium]